MKTWERWTFGLSALGVATTGAAYFWMKYFVVSDDPFAVVNHPWQGAMLAAHVVLAPALILMFGILLNGHVLRKLGAKNTPNRRSGLVSFWTFAVMTASGYLLQVVTADAWLRTLIAVHVTSGAIFSVVYAAHLIISVRIARVQTARRIPIQAA
jgi:hypothetical protein